MDRLFTDYDTEAVRLVHVLHCTESEPPWQHPCPVGPYGTVTVTAGGAHSVVSHLPDRSPSPPCSQATTLFILASPMATEFEQLMQLQERACGLLADRNLRLQVVPFHPLAEFSDFEQVGGRHR